VLFRSRGGFVVDLNWLNGQVSSARILSTLGGLCRVHCAVPLALDGVAEAVINPVFETKPNGIYSLRAAE